MDLRAMVGESFQDESTEDGGGGGSGDTSDIEQLGMSGGVMRNRPVKVIPCPRCQSMNTKFCYYNNYSVAQPRHFCRNCQRYWTVGGTLRNVPVGGGSRKKTRTRSRSDPYNIPTYDSATPQASPDADPLLNASTCMLQLSMLPPSLGFVGGFPTTSSQLPFLQFALDGLSGGPYPRTPSAGLQEVPDVQSVYEVPQMTPPMATPPMPMNGMSFFTPESFPLQSNESLVSVMAKAGLWSSGMQAPAPEVPTSQLGGYGQRNLSQNVLSENLKAGGFWENALMQSRLVMDDRLVPHTSWESNPSTTHNTPNLSPNGSSTTDHTPSFSHGYYEDVSQPWAGLHSTDILNF